LNQKQLFLGIKTERNKSKSNQNFLLLFIKVGGQLCTFVCCFIACKLRKKTASFSN